MKQKFYLIEFPDIQDYQIHVGYSEHSYMCTDIAGAAFVEADWADAVDKGFIPVDPIEAEDE